MLTVSDVKPEDFPQETSRTIWVPCTYQDEHYVSGTVHLLDRGSCMIPRNKTITIDQWKSQQKR